MALVNRRISNRTDPAVRLSAQSCRSARLRSTGTKCLARLVQCLVNLSDEFEQFLGAHFFRGQLALRANLLYVQNENVCLPE